MIPSYESTAERTAGSRRSSERSVPSLLLLMDAGVVEALEKEPADLLITPLLFPPVRILWPVAAGGTGVQIDQDGSSLGRRPYCIRGLSGRRCGRSG